MIQVALMVMFMRRLDDDAAADNVPAVVFEALGTLPHLALQRRRRVHVSKRNFEWFLHIDPDGLNGIARNATLGATSRCAEVVIMLMRINRRVPEYAVSLSAVGDFYGDLGQTSDAEIREFLAAAHDRDTEQ